MAVRATERSREPGSGDREPQLHGISRHGGIKASPSVKHQAAAVFGPGQQHVRLVQQASMAAQQRQACPAPCLHECDQGHQGGAHAPRGLP